ncbi:MAG: O-antigen ligase family protein [Legionellales bacterium]
MRLFSYRSIQALLLTMTLFALPVSNSLKSIFLVLSILSILSQPGVLSLCLQVIRKPWCQATLFLFTLLALSACWGDADWKSKLGFINKYSKLLFLPILVIGFQNQRTRNIAIHAFLLAMSMTLILSVFKSLNWMMMNTDGDPGTVFLNRIDTGYYMAFSAFISALYSTKSQGYYRWGYALLALLFSYQTFFINTGRTGYIAFAVLFILFILFSVSWRKIPIYLLLLAPLVAITVYQSTTFTHRIQDVIQDVRSLEVGQKDTSLGFRLEFQHFAKKLFLSSPILGVGIAGYSWHFNQEQPVPSWQGKTFDPHNQYWLIAAENGLVGLLFLLYFFMTLFYTCRQLNEMRPLVIALLVSFVVASLIDSFLLLSSVGYLLIFFTAIGLGELTLDPNPTRDVTCSLS